MGVDFVSWLDPWGAVLVFGLIALVMVFLFHD